MAKNNTTKNTNKNDNTISFGIVSDTQGLVQLKDYLKRATSFMKAAATSMQSAFNSLDSVFKNTNTGGQSLTSTSIKDVSGSYTDISTDMKNASDSMVKSNKKIEDSNKDVAESFELIEYAAVSVFRKILNTSIKIYKRLSLAGSNMVETNSRFNYVLGGLAKEAEEYAEAIANAYAITETEAKTAMTRIYQMAKSAGLSSSTALKMAKNLTVVGAELSSVWDVSTEQSVNALISALQGLPKAAKNLGVFTNVNEYKELLKEAGIATEGVLTQNEKITGAFLKILKDSGYAIGDFSRTQTSVANQLRLVNSAVTSISENLGATMNTILSPLLQVVNFFLKQLVRMTNILNDMPEPIKMVVGLFATMAIAIPIVISLIVLLTRIKQIYKNQVDQLTKSLAAQTTVMGRLGNAMFTKVIPSFITISKITIPFAIFLGSIITLFQKLNEKTEDNKNSLKDYKNAVEESQKALAGYDDVNVMNFDSASGLDSDNLERIMDTLGITTTEIDELGNKFIWLYGIMAVGSGVATVANIIKNWQAITKVFKTMRSFVGGAILSLQLSLESFATMMTFSVIGVAGLIAAFVSLYKIFTIDWHSPAQKIVAIIGTIVLALGSLAVLVGALTKNALLLSAGLGAMVSGGALTISAFSKNSEQLKQAEKIPAAATGGTTIGPTHALVGEGRYREAIIPLGNSAEFASMKRDITSAVLAGLSASGGSNGNINITVNVDEDYIYKAYNRQKELRGGSV